ncbi:hypothetical protein [Planococcus sp. YIM B11945]|uniref:hypothetical protein n=1 Tax=Planococcus sp. YIM B11945 TaxID=3435410 RepID=UPI003D7DA4CA
MADEKKEFVIYMPVAEEEEKGQFRIQNRDLKKALPVSLENIHELVKDLSGYSLDTIELHVTGVVKSGPITELFIGAEGEAGMKLVLNKKKEQHTKTSTQI